MMKETESIHEFITRAQGVVNQLRIQGETITEQTIVEKILRSLPPKFDPVVIAIEESKDLTTFKVAELTGSLQSHEERMQRSTESLVQAFQSSIKLEEKSPHTTKYQGESSSNNRGRGRGRGRGNNRGRGRSSVDRRSIQCRYCERYGHYESECRKKKSDLNKSRANYTEDSSADTKHSTFFTCNMAKEHQEDVWFLDSGCSNHMTDKSDLFVKLDDSVRSQVKFGDDKEVDVMGKGTLAFKTKQGETTHIHDTLFVPQLQHNLLSIGQLVGKNYKVVFEDNCCKIFDKSNNHHLVAKTCMTENRLFPLTLVSSQLHAFKSTTDDSWLWHQRYGHLNFQGLSLLNKKNMVRGLPPIKEKEEVCSGCAFGKHHRDSFPVNKSWRAKSPLELVHADTCGDMQEESLGKNLYFLTFIDDYSRHTWVYFLKQKSEAFTCFKNFKAMAEKQSGYHVKILRTDRGGEFTSNEFADFCIKNGIQRQLTAAYTPQQNGIAERKNRTIMEMARSMLQTKNLPNTFWGEAVATTVYILNRSPTKAVQNITPKEAWSGHKPSVAHLRVFGCLAYVHVPVQKRKKLDAKSQLCIFVGYSTATKGYRFYNPDTKQWIVSRDVIFDEGGVWQWKDVVQQNPSLIINMEDNTIPPLPTSSSGSSSSSSNPPSSPSSSSSKNSDSDSPPPSPPPLVPRKVRSLVDIYQRSANIVLVVNFALFSTIQVEPSVYEEAVKEPVWVNAMNDEMNSIHKNNTWELVQLPKDKQVIGVKWIYKVKYHADGSVERHKERLVAKGFAQTLGVDYAETFALVARLDTVKIILSVAAQYKWPIFQMDVKSAFLNGYIDEEVYVEQPMAYEVQGKEHLVYKLKKALYGLKQAPRAWYARIDNYFMKKGFNRSHSEPTLYVQRIGNDILIVFLYVDDLIYTGNNKALIEKFQAEMKQEFEMSDLGLMHYFLGVEVLQTSKGIYISQTKYVADLLKKFRMMACKAFATPIAIGEKLTKEDISPKVDATLYRSLAGSLMYLTTTRPDIMYAVSLISRFMQDPHESHWRVAKRILRYVSGTHNFGIHYSPTKQFELVGYTNSDWAGSVDDRKSTSGYVFSLGSGVVSWSSKKQATVALSSAEAEYMVASLASSQAVWMRRILTDLHLVQEHPTTIYCDNNSTISMTKNPVFHARTKHIEIRHHYIRDLVQDGQVELQFCPTSEQIADIFTKALSTASFVALRN